MKTVSTTDARRQLGELVRNPDTIQVTNRGTPVGVLRIVGEVHYNRDKAMAAAKRIREIGAEYAPSKKHGGTKVIRRPAACATMASERLVIDASFVVEAVLPTHADWQRQAYELMDRLATRDIEGYVPWVFFCELASAITKKVRARRLDPDDAADFLQQVDSLGFRATSPWSTRHRCTRRPCGGTPRRQTRSM